MRKKNVGLILIAFIFCPLFKSYTFPYKRYEEPSLLTYKFKTNPITISGVVKDKESGESLPFANVIVKDTNIGSITNEDGFFTLFNVPSDASTIQVQFMGYKTEILTLTTELVNDKIIILMTPDSNQLEEVVLSLDSGKEIIQMNKNVSQISLSPKKLASIPNLGEKDIFRALQLLPGISGTNESSSGLYIRGGTPDQNLVLLDGFTVYHVDHFYGFFSAFNSDVIKDVQLFKGGFPAKYGGRISSVMDLTGKTGNSNKFTLSSSISLLSANATVEIPIGNKANILISGRRSEATLERAKELKINDVYNGVLNKIKPYEELKEKYNADDSEIMYIGDDLIDIPIMEKVAAPIATNNACEQCKEIAIFVTERSGGDGAFRDAVEWILNEKNIFYKTVTTLRDHVQNN